MADSDAVIRDPRGNEYGMVVDFRDFTERRLRRVLTENANEPHVTLYLVRFEIVNDTGGHMAGDALLHQFALHR